MTVSFSRLEFQPMRHPKPRRIKIVPLLVRELPDPRLPFADHAAAQAGEIGNRF
ncbi:hypothetical protein [uncultured Methylovirgula sp.]|uniref:hypothetical protein n=1 Tax=uncultured Methylovirgula sp. TaxID=1285960 RepID=UPI002621425B|nr:hypothetical protein [uncultured Methylovirgula sp.]